MMARSLDHEYLEKELKEFISCSSYNSSFEMAELVQRRLQMLDMDAEILPSEIADTVLCSVGEGPGVLLAAHLDTVAPKNGDACLRPRVEDGKLHGLGASDDKSGVATLLAIAKCLDQRRLRDRIVFVFAGKEENVPRDQNPLWQMRSLSATRGIYLEPTLDGTSVAQIGMGCMGLLRLRVRFEGERIASWHANGARNPICMAAEFITRFGEWSKEIGLQAGERRVLGQAQQLRNNMNVTEIVAQEGAGVIPAEATLTVDCRLLPPELAPSQESCVSPGTAFSVVDGLRAQCQVGKAREVPKPTTTTSEYAGYLLEDQRLYDQCAKHLLASGLTPRPWFAPWRTDSALLVLKHGIPTLVIGPGQYAQCHKIDEHILLDPFHRCADALWNIVADMVY
jgi:acetylornithine deacetylase/succinyl-diaminopimelate desuccinylase-like protein